MPYSPNIEEFPPLLREFASYKKNIQGCSPKTTDEYLTDLKIFFKFIYATDNDIPTEGEEFENISIADFDNEYLVSVTTNQIYDFLYYIDSVRSNKNCAKARKLCAIRAFFKYAVTKRFLLETSPAANIDSPKQKKTLPRFLSLDESIKLLSAIKNDTESNTVERDYAMITLFLNCGMRVSELVGISIGDYDREALEWLRVTGKGNKERMIYLNSACKEALIPYLKIRYSEKYRAVTDKALFLSRLESRISVKTVQHIVYKYLERAGLDSKRYSVHKLRHTAATLMYQSGNVDIRVLKDILGHEQLNTTQIYTHVSDANMKAAMDNNPLASISLSGEKDDDSEE